MDQFAENQLNNMANFIELELTDTDLSTTTFKKNYINVDLVVRIGDGLGEKYRACLYMANGRCHYTKLDKHQLKELFEKSK